MPMHPKSNRLVSTVPNESLILVMMYSGIFVVFSLLANPKCTRI